MADTIEKVSIIISKGSLDGIYPGLIMANGARAEGIEANLFFTFFGLDAVHKERHEHIKLATVVALPQALEWIAAENERRKALRIRRIRFIQAYEVAADLVARHDAILREVNGYYLTGDLRLSRRFAAWVTAHGSGSSG